MKVLTKQQINTYLEEIQLYFEDNKKIFDYLNIELEDFQQDILETILIAQKISKTVLDSNSVKIQMNFYINKRMNN